MKFLWCVLLLSIVLVDGKGVLYNIPEKFIPNLIESSAECLSKTDLEPDAGKKIINGEIENTESFKKFLYCFAKRSGYTNKDGHFNLDKMAELVENHKKKPQFMDCLKECNKLKGSDAHDTMYKVAICFRDTSPIRFAM